MVQPHKVQGQVPLLFLGDGSLLWSNELADLSVLSAALLMLEMARVGLNLTPVLLSVFGILGGVWAL